MPSGWATRRSWSASARCWTGAPPRTPCAGSAGENGGDLKELVRWIADETVLGVGLDRRTLQRAETTWMSIKQRIAVSSSEGPASGYEVLVGPGTFGSIGTILSNFCPAQRYAVVTDDRVAELYAVRLSRMLHAAGYRADVFAFTAGEARKTRETWALVCDAMMEAGLGRDSAVVAFGGGVPGDLGGFVAATYMRGLPWCSSYLAAGDDRLVGRRQDGGGHAGGEEHGGRLPPAALRGDRPRPAAHPSPRAPARRDGRGGEARRHRGPRVPGLDRAVRAQGCWRATRRRSAG
jgi:hypothetical protein